MLERLIVIVIRCVAISRSTCDIIVSESLKDEPRYIHQTSPHSFLKTCDQIFAKSNLLYLTDRKLSLLALENWEFFLNICPNLGAIN